MERSLKEVGDKIIETVRGYVAAAVRELSVRIERTEQQTDGLAEQFKAAESERHGGYLELLQDFKSAEEHFAARCLEVFRDNLDIFKGPQGPQGPQGPREALPPRVKGRWNGRPPKGRSF